MFVEKKILLIYNNLRGHRLYLIACTAQNVESSCTVLMGQLYCTTDTYITLKLPLRIRRLVMKKWFCNKGELTTGSVILTFPVQCNLQNLGHLRIQTIFHWFCHGGLSLMFNCTCVSGKHGLFKTGGLTVSVLPAVCDCAVISNIMVLLYQQQP